MSPLNYEIVRVEIRNIVIGILSIILNPINQLQSVSIMLIYQVSDLFITSVSRHFRLTKHYLLSYRSTLIRGTRTVLKLRNRDRLVQQ